NVDIHQEDYDVLIGSSPPLIEHLLEIRGLCMIDVMSLFGAGSVINSKEISLIINLELCNQKAAYDRIVLNEDKMRIMDVYIPILTIILRPSLNLTAID